MKKNYILFHIIFLSYTSFVRGQGEWATLTFPNSYFSFQMPSLPDSGITETDMYYSYYSTANSCSLTCALALVDSSFESILNTTLQQDSITPEELPDSVKNPIIITRTLFSYLFKNYSELYNEDLETENTAITANEFHVTFTDEYENDMILYARLYYNGHDFASFYVKGLLSHEETLNEIKDQFFGSIQLINF